MRRADGGFHARVGRDSIVDLVPAPVWNEAKLTRLFGFIQLWIFAVIVPLAFSFRLSQRSGFRTIDRSGRVVGGDEPTSCLIVLTRAGLAAFALVSTRILAIRRRLFATSGSSGNVQPLTRTAVFPGE
jgi:hypothetical protein